MARLEPAVGRKLSYSERERRRRAKEAERDRNQRRRRKDREHRASVQRREKEADVRRRTSERATRRRERERERDRIVYEKRQAQEERERQQRGQERQAVRAAQKFEDRVAWLTSVHSSRLDLDDFDSELQKRLKPRQMTIVPFEDACFDDVRAWKRPMLPTLAIAAHRRWVASPESSFSYIPGGALVGFAVAALIAWLAAGLDADVMLTGWIRQTSLLVGALVLGAASAIGSLMAQAATRGSAHDATARDYAREEEALDPPRLAQRRTERRAAVLARHKRLRQWQADCGKAVRRHQARRVSFNQSEADRRQWYDEQRACEAVRFARWDRERMDCLETAMADPAACTKVMRRAFPLFLPAAATEGSADNWAAIHGKKVQGIVQGKQLVLQIELLPDLIAPKKTIGVAANGRKNTSRNMPAGKRVAAQDGFVASFALAHAIRGWQVAPWLEQVLVEVFQPGTDPSTGKARDEILLSAYYPKDTVADVVFNNLDAVAFLDRLEHQRRSVKSKSKKMLASWLPAGVELVGMAERLMDSDKGLGIQARVQPEYKFGRRSSAFATRDKLLPSAKDWTSPHRWRVVRKKATARKHWTPLEIRQRLTADRTHATISDAVDKASAGDTIYIEPGVYDERVVVKKPITLQGAPGVEVFQDGDDPVRIYCVGVTARRLRLKSTGEGFVGPLYQAGISIAVVEDCELVCNTRYGVWQSQPGSVLHLIGCTVSGIDGQGPNTGVRSPPEAQSLLEDVQITDATTGIVACDLTAESVVIKGSAIGVENSGDRLDPDVALITLIDCTVQDSGTALRAYLHGRIEHTDCVFVHNERLVGEGKGEVISTSA